MLDVSKIDPDVLFFPIFNQKLKVKVVALVGLDTVLRFRYALSAALNRNERLIANGCNGHVPDPAAWNC